MRIFENVLVKTSVLPQSASAVVTGASVDARGFGEAMAVVTVGAATGTPTSFTVNAKLQGSNDGSTWADVPGAAMTQLTAGSKTAEIKVDIEKSVDIKRYVRLVITPALSGGTSPAIPVAGVILLSHPERSEFVTNSTTGN